MLFDPTRSADWTEPLWTQTLQSIIQKIDERRRAVLIAHKLGLLASLTQQWSNQRENNLLQQNATDRSYLSA
jgi:predicted alpha/beta hydrolase family esterase